ncbi:hypothetical protein D3C77_480330 [compost metagenome]
MPNSTQEQIDAQNRAIDAHNKEVDAHNAEQERIGLRAIEVIKMLFVMSGGALAVCANFFSAKVQLPPTTIFPIQFAWVSLTTAILVIGLTLILLLGRDYRAGLHNSRQLSTGQQAPETSDAWEFGIWVTGLVGFVSFCAGMCSFTYAAWIYLSS